jgi:DNA-binding MarR family transcriptional regulator
MLVKSRVENLRGLVQTFVRRFGLLDAARTPCGKPIPISAAHALFELSRTPGIDQVEVALRLGMSKSAVSRLLAGLERRDLLRRERSKDDGRARRLSLTAKGKRMAAEISRASLAFFDEIVAALPKQSVGRLCEGLSDLIRAIPAPQRGRRSAAEGAQQ